MTELWNLYDQDGNITADILKRGDTMPRGRFHLVVHIWLYDYSHRYLIQKRSTRLTWQPGIWAATGGSAVLGENSRQAIIRESKEELNLDLSTNTGLKKVNRLRRETHFLDVWKAPINSLITENFQPTAEVEAVAFKSISEISQMVEAGLFFPYPDDYFSLIGLSTSPDR